MVLHRFPCVMQGKEEGKGDTEADSGHDEIEVNMCHSFSFLCHVSFNRYYRAVLLTVFPNVVILLCTCRTAPQHVTHGYRNLYYTQTLVMPYVYFPSRDLRQVNVALNNQFRGRGMPFSIYQLRKDLLMTKVASLQSSRAAFCAPSS